MAALQSGQDCSDGRTRAVWRRLDRVPDPEIPVLSIVDLGIVRGVDARADGVEVALAPTYSGCPATEVIEASVIAALDDDGLGPVTVRRELSPPWTTDWISDEGREKLRAYGIAPPPKGESVSKKSMLGAGIAVHCPRCNSDDTQRVSEFGSTPCKASYRCRQCLEPFDYFKCI